MGRLIVPLICSVLVGLAVPARSQKQATATPANREVKVHIEGNEVDSLDLLRQLNARGAKSRLNFVETKEGFDYKVKVETAATTLLTQRGFVGANVVVESNKGETLFFFRGPGRINAARALDATAQEIIK